MTDKERIEDQELDGLTGGLGEDDGQGPTDMTVDTEPPAGSGSSAESVAPPDGGATITPDN